MTTTDEFLEAIKAVAESGDDLPSNRLRQIALLADSALKRVKPYKELMRLLVSIGVNAVAWLPSDRVTHRIVRQAEKGIALLEAEGIEKPSVNHGPVS